MAKFRRAIPFAFTPISNHFIEHQSNSLSESELRVYMAIVRLTWGHGKPNDTISISQIVSMAKIPRRSVDWALKRLREAGLLVTTGPKRRAQLFEIQTPKRARSGSAKLIALPSPR